MFIFFFFFKASISFSLPIDAIVNVFLWVEINLRKSSFWKTVFFRIIDVQFLLKGISGTVIKTSKDALLVGVGRKLTAKNVFIVGA